MEYQHLHADIARNLNCGGFRDDDHEADRQRYSPDGRLFAEDTGKWMFEPEVAQGGAG